MNDYTQDIENLVFLLKDKLKMMEMILYHAKVTALELDEKILDMQEEQFLERCNTSKVK
jgi:hypothetical protein